MQFFFVVTFFLVVFQVSVVIAISGWMEEDQDYRRSFGVLPDNEHISTEVASH